MATALRESYSHPLNLPGLRELSIWGPTWQAFMGMPTDEGGVNPIADQPGDWTRAREAESYIFRCEDIRTQALSRVPLRVWQTGRDGKPVSIEHEALDVLSQTNPFGYVDGPALTRYTLMSLDLHGRCAWRLAFNRKKTPSEIYWVIPTQFNPLGDPDKWFGGIRWTTEHGVQDIAPEKLCYFATDNPANPLLGTSKIMVLRNAINLRAYSARSNIDFFKNSMRPDLIVTGEWNNTNENMQRLRREWMQAFSGESNKSPFFAGNNTKATLLTQTAKDMEWLAQQRLSQEEISATFGVPLVYLNNFDRATYENISVAKIILYHDTVIPEGEKLSGMYNRQFLWRFWPESKGQRISLGFDFTEIEGLGEDIARIWERVSKMSAQISEQVKNRELTPDQARLLRAQLFTHLGIDTTAFEDAIPGGKVFFEQFGNLPIDQLSVQAIMNIEAARSSSPLASELIEDVPGAPNAGKNAQRVADTQREQDERAHQDRLAAINSKPTPAPRAASKALRVASGPNAKPIRDARLAPIQAQLQRRLKKHFQGLKLQAERTLRGGAKFLVAKEMGDIDPNQNLYDSQKSQDDLADLILAEGIVLATVAAYETAKQDYGLDVRIPRPNLDLEAYVAKRMALIRGIDATLRNDLFRVMASALQEGDSIAKMADDVRVVFQSAIDHQSEVIARTETMQAYAAASIAAYRKAGLDQVRMYDGDNADSADCDVVDGMVVTLAEAEQLMAQEHPNGTRGVSPVVDLHLASVSVDQVLGPGVRMVA